MTDHENLISTKITKPKKIKDGVAQKDQVLIKTISLENEIKNIVSRVTRIDKAEIKNDVSLREQLGLDSLNAMEILAAIEVKYGITVDEARAFDVVTFKDLCELVKSYLKNT